MDRQLSLEFARITEQAALKSARLVGLGDKEGADQAAVDGMHEQFALTPVSGTVVIGEGEIDEAPMLYIGEHVGQGGEDVDIAKLRSGEETRSAVMIRNIPNRFSKDELCEILDGFVAGKYSIMNMPLDSKTHRNLGYCFIQFNTVEDLFVAYDCVSKDRVAEV